MRPAPLFAVLALVLLGVLSQPAPGDLSSDRPGLGVIEALADTPPRKDERASPGDQNDPAPDLPAHSREQRDAGRRLALRHPNPGRLRPAWRIAAFARAPPNRDV